MTWRNIVYGVIKNWPQSEQGRVLTDLANDYDHAERLGFVCALDDRLGYGRCFFTKGPVRVWESPDGWCRAESVGAVGHFQNHRYYHTLGQALTNDSARAYRNSYGVLVQTPSREA